MKKLLVVLLALASIAFQSSVNAEPICELSIDSLNAVLEHNEEVSQDFFVRNTGDTALEWTLERRQPGDQDFEPWDRREPLMIGSTLGITRIQGVVFAEGKYVVAAGPREGHVSNMIYILDTEMTVLDSFPQFGDTRLGMYDLGWDGELVWGADNTILYGFTVAGELVKQFEVPIEYVRGVEWDSRNQQLLVCGRSTWQSLLGFDRDGRQLNDYGPIKFARSGIGFWRDDPDGYPVYLFRDDGITVTVHKMNLETKDTLFVTSLAMPEGGLAEGCFITNTLDPYSWTFICLVNGTDINVQYSDRIDVWHLKTINDWFSVVNPLNPEEPVVAGSISAGDSLALTLTIKSGSMSPFIYSGELLFHHNAEPAESRIGITLEVFGNEPPGPFFLAYPFDQTILDGNDSTEFSFEWESSPDRNKADRATYVLYLQPVSQPVRPPRSAPVVHLADTSTVINLLEVPWEQYLLKPPKDSLTAYKWWVVAVSGSDTTMCTFVYRFTYRLKALDVTDQPVPVVFGLNSVYPSPFNGMTTIRYGVDRIEPMTLRVYDLTGRLMATLVDEPAQIGTHSVVWNASGFSSGVYLIRLEAGGRVHTVKTALIK